MRGADVVGPPATERSQVLFFPVRIVVASLAIVVSLRSFIRAIGFPALPPDGFFCCISRLTLSHVLYNWRSRDYYGVPWYSISCLFPLSHRLVLITLSFQRPHSYYGVFVSRFHGWERKSLACIAFCSDSLILTGLRVFVHRWQVQVWQRMRLCCCYQSFKLSSLSV